MQMTTYSVIHQNEKWYVRMQGIKFPSCTLESSNTVGVSFNLNEDEFAVFHTELKKSKK